MGCIICDFCHEKLVDDINLKDNEKSCKNKELISDGLIICINCGVVDSYQTVPEYLDFYENRYKMRRKIGVSS